MNVFSRILLHLRRSSLRKQFKTNRPALEQQFRDCLIAQTTDQRQWLDIEWITEPVLHVHPDILQLPIALIGVTVVYQLIEEGEVPQPATQAGTALFYFQNTQWQTSGKLLLNLTPSEALNQLELKTISAPA